MDYKLIIRVSGYNDYQTSGGNFPCGDRIKRILTKTFITTNKEHLDLYVSFIKKFKFDLELERVNDLTLKITATNESVAIFTFRIFRYLKNDSLMQVLVDANSYRVQAHTALCLAYYKNMKLLKNYHDSRYIFMGIDNGVIPDIITKKEFNKRIKDSHNYIFTNKYYNYIASMDETKRLQNLNVSNFKHVTRYKSMGPEYKNLVEMYESFINKNDQRIKELEVLKSRLIELHKLFDKIRKLIAEKKLRQAISLMRKTDKICTNWK